jgi:endonuclease G, mitochondrial
MLISLSKLEESEKRFVAIQKKIARDDSDFSEEALIVNVPPEITKGNILGSEDNLAKRFQMLESTNIEPVEFAFERTIGENDSVYSNFVELIRNAKQKVGRIAIKEGSRNIAYATGFMVSENLLLTNWHVFKTKEAVADSEIQFYYELDTSGNPGSPISFKLQSETFYYSNEELDYCFVSVGPTDISGKWKLSDIGYIFLDPTLGKIGDENKEALNIIHHPEGDYMQLSIRENLFVNIAPTSIWYKTDTAPGSSGSPVFNDQWQVVALHHMGVGRKNAVGEYIDKDGKVIPKIDGKIDGSRVVWDANEGIRISVILKDMFNKFPDLPIVKNLQNKPGLKSIIPDRKDRAEKVESTDYNSNHSEMEQNNTDMNVNISFPASLIEKNGTINININQGNQSAITKPIEISPRTPTEDDLDFAEIKKLEDTTDYSLCKGYQPKFLGSKFNVGLPQPQKSITKFIAKVSGTNSIELNYFNYSTIFHSVRMMPILSAINVNGDPAKRQDNSARKDVWLRDNRLSFDIQLGDSYYKGSGFDRGHMSRREDANWGASPEIAKRNADLTCMYTNACPQVAKINQSGKKGLWGILEKVVLEKGAVIENGKTAKITVFNGPIFKNDDPVFRGIQVPMDFYKIVLWLTDNGDLKATAFKLSQVELIDDIDFEQLDLDQNTEFKEYQCSIKSLQDETKIDFSALLQFDTFDGNAGEEIALSSEHAVLNHISKHNL